MLTITDKTIDRKLALGDNVDKRQRNCQWERAVQTEGRKLGSCTNNRQVVDAQKAVQADSRMPESSTKKR